MGLNTFIHMLFSHSSHHFREMVIGLSPGYEALSRQRVNSDVLLKVSDEFGQKTQQELKQNITPDSCGFVS